MAAESASTSPLARRWWLNLALLALVAALGLYAWYRAGQPAEAPKTTLTALPADAVQAIEIVRPQAAPVRLERRDGEWRLAAPLEARADSFAVEALLRILRAPIESTITTAASDLARYGLDRPRATVRFGTTEIRFGEIHPLKDQYYVQYGEAVHLIASHYYAQATTPPTSLIDSRLLEPGRKPVGFKLPGFTLTLKDGEWQREPKIEALSSDRINGFVDDWRHARALQVEKYSGKKARERVVITVENPDGGKSELIIGVLARQPELVLYRPDEGLEYRFPEDTAQRLLNLKTEDRGQKTEPENR